MTTRREMMAEYREGGVLVVYRNDDSVLPNEPIRLKIFDNSDEFPLHYISFEKAICIRNLLHRAIIDLSIDTGETRGVSL
jgi:hypothetical protein